MPAGRDEQPALFTLNADGAFGHEPANDLPFKEGGITYAYADGLNASEVTGIPRACSADSV
ncbi:hypothetical protein [Streptomyces sp. NPDC048565]|uniref:hypothetical protein n=1 Tax=Streptomyces sp. NPDC048565 TaxID=3155266 RepID=UPI0034403659